jgi:hypothetical protein
MLLCRTRTQSWDAGNGCRERVKVGKDARFAHHLHAHAGAVGADIGGVRLTGKVRPRAADVLLELDGGACDGCAACGVERSINREVLVDGCC